MAHGHYYDTLAIVLHYYDTIAIVLHCYGFCLNLVTHFYCVVSWLTKLGERANWCNSEKAKYKD